MPKLSTINWTFLLIFNYFYGAVDSGFLDMFVAVEQPVLENFEIQDSEHTIMSSTVTSVSSCIQECMSDMRCMSVSYNNDTHVCWSYDVVYGSVEKGVASTYTRHYHVGENYRCPIVDGYIQFRTIDGCYKPQPDKSGAYADADDACAADGAHLVKFDDVTEKTTITTVLSASDGYNEPYWTGAYQDGPGNTWVWRDGTPVSVADTFRPGEPSGSGPCAYFSLQDNGYNDFPCASWPRIFCEKDMP